jgi:hypothetical protein
MGRRSPVKDWETPVTNYQADKQLALKNFISHCSHITRSSPVIREMHYQVQPYSTQKKLQ